MICPICGYDMGSKNKCLRCGYENKDLAVVDEHAQNDDAKDGGGQTEQKEQPQVIDIDPTNVYLTHPYGYEDESGTGFGPFGNPFSSLFDDLFGVDPLADLLGGLFGFDVVQPRRPQREEPPKKRKKQGPIVEVSEVEFVDENGKPIDGDVDRRAEREKPKSEHNTSDPHKKRKNPFSRKHKK